MIDLFEIQKTIKQITEAISSVLDMDVLICDNNYAIVSDTYKHMTKGELHIDAHSILGNVINTGKQIIVIDKKNNFECINCSEINLCKLNSMIGVPINYNGNIIGAIGLIVVTTYHKNILVEKQLYLFDFLNRMSELIVSKLIEKEDEHKLKIMTRQKDLIIDSIDEGIISINELGEIIYMNTKVKEYFNLKSEDLIYTNIINIKELDFLKSLVEKKDEFTNKEFEFNFNYQHFKGLITCRKVTIDGKCKGFILIFREMSEVFNFVKSISMNNLATGFEEIIGQSTEILHLKEETKRVANGDSTILIQGESGTGKELFARAIHSYSDRSESYFIPINCAAIPETLLESELFGYEAGAFTGAKQSGKVGKFELADKGTIFLDEIGDMPLYLQTKLLRVLQEKTIEKIGATKPISVDVRIIAATHRDLEEMVALGQFRQDLYYRLNVIPIHIPPLRARHGDIELLANHFINKCNLKLNKKILGLSNEAKQLLLSHPWKGNVRELENVIEYAVNFETTSYITVDNISRRLKRKKIQNNNMEFDFTTFDEMEKYMISKAIERYGENHDSKSKIANLLGISRATLYRKIKKYNLEK